MSHRERTLLSPGLAARALRDGNYASIAVGANVRQPIVSMALHQRLVVRTTAVTRLFEYLGIEAGDPEIERQLVGGSDAKADQSENSSKDDTGGERFVDLVDAVRTLSDGSDEQDIRLVEFLSALRRFARPTNEGRGC